MIANRLMMGDTIGIVSPASFEKYETIKNGICNLEKLGFRVKLGEHVYDKWGGFAGKDEDRAKDLMSMFLDKEVKMILCTRGGYGSMRIISYLDFDIIRNNPKVFMGYSDITILLNYIYERTHMITFHGPMLNSNLDDIYTKESFLGTINRVNKSYSICNPKNITLEYKNKGNAHGKLVGGNLCILCSTLGTKYEIDTEGKILFLEEIGEEPYKIDRMLTQLTEAGKLKKCKGFILGQFTECGSQGDNVAFSLQEVIEDRILRLNKPTVFNLAAGHEYPKITLPIGALINLDCFQKKVQVIEPVVR